MEYFKNIAEHVAHAQLVNSLIVVIISILLYKFVTHFFNGKEKNSNLRMFKSKKGKTYYKLMKSLIRYVFIIVTVLIILQINGVNVSSMLAGVGIIGVIVGFAVQDALKDIVKGIDIISDSYYHVGDVIKFKDIEGKVLSIGIKTTKIEDIKNQNNISISNRNIDQVEVVSNYIYVDIPMPYEVSVVRAEDVITDIIDLIRADKLIDVCTYNGVNNLDDSSIKYQIKITCNPIQKLQVRRNVLRNILVGLENNGISVPYNQIDVHQK